MSGKGSTSQRKRAREIVAGVFAEKVSDDVSDYGTDQMAALKVEIFMEVKRRISQAELNVTRFLWEREINEHWTAVVRRHYGA
ncbi:MAG: hypothetical protein WC107_01715 [Patescibacteria group bacterium]